MKKLSFLLGLILVSGLIFTSCSKDDTEDPVPSIVFLGGVEPTTQLDRVDGDVTLNVGEKFVFGFTASSESDKNLSNIKVNRNYENVSVNTVLDTAISVKSFTIDIIVNAFPNVPGSEVFEITALDKNGQSSTISFTVTTVIADPGIQEFTDISLGSYNSTTNSSFASVTGETFSLPEANADESVQAKIDWVYFHGSANGQTLMSPSNATIEAIYPAIADWANRNTTHFAETALSENDYANIETKTQMIAIIGTQGYQFNKDFYAENQLQDPHFNVGDVIVIETGAGKFGMILITQVNPGTTNGLSTIKYDIKMEK